MRRALAIAGLLLAAMTPGAAHAKDAQAPRETHPSEIYDVFDNSLVRPITRELDAARFVRGLAKRKREAANVDAQDQVRLPSTWWQPRAGYVGLTPEQVREGPEGPTPAPGTWTVTHAKTAGVTPGFQIKDSAGNKFFLKFDAKGWPDLSTGAEVIGARLFWAAGYNVPCYTIAYVRLADLTIAPGVKYKDDRGHEEPLTRDYLEKLLAQVERRPDGTYRCDASLALEGEPIGPFSFTGRRHDDPEDLVPHELRRELRGLWTMCAWTNHADSRSANTLDTWVLEGGRSFVRHHLIDFSAVLGAGRNGPRARPTGTEYYVDYGVMSRQAVTLGLHPFRWEASPDPPAWPSVGFVDERTFDAETWRPDYPNPMFDDRTHRDVIWGARIVGAFSDDMIRAAVSAADYSDPRAQDYITHVLIGRRDKIVHRWLQPRPATRGTPMQAAR
jgi:hypothetical protein